MASDKKYTSHLCTFMGREANLKVLIPYIDSALKIGAVDNYWFIDMTRSRGDHELIKKMSKELDEKYPGRVHLYNSEARGKIIDNKEKIVEASKSWETFYKFLRRFNDNDIIAKCDDDIYYIDVETLKAAYEFRWNNKKPYLMHANCINNGLTAYQMNKKGVFNDKESSIYPFGGLTGPLFAHPEVACKHHEQFTNDMLTNRDNINKYKLGKNIQFCNRVSINFIFMLGKDRHELSKITYQDEYDTSCKYPQRENRPNVLIGDFTVAHHTYGPQEPVMEELKTHVGYEKLCDILNTSDVEYENKTIGMDLNATTTIAAKGKMLMRAWVEENSYIIKDPETGRYIQLANELNTNQPNPALRSILVRGDKNVQKACIFNTDIKKNECMFLNNSTSLLRTPAGSHEVEAAFPMASFHQSQYLKSQITIKPSGAGKYTLHPEKNPEYRLIATTAHPNAHKNNSEGATKNEKQIQWSKKTEPGFLGDRGVNFEWELIPLQSYANSAVAGVITRPANFNHVANDETTAWDASKILPENNCSREWIWMVKDYIWEMVPTPKENTYKIKLVADDKPDMYLFYQQAQDKLITGGGGDEWECVEHDHKYLKHASTGKWLSLTDNQWKLSGHQSPDTRIAMCPLH